jgi:hypothetical protein
MTTAKRPASYGPVQMSAYLGICQWQVERAVNLGLIPAPDRSPRRWSTAVVDGVQARLEEVLARVGTVPDVGAVRAAEVLAERLGVDVEPDTVIELARKGLLAEAGDYKSHPLYSGLDLDAFDDRQALATAAHDGRMLTADAASDYLKIRRSDFDHLTRTRWLEPARYGLSAWSRRRDRPDVPLYRAGDLDVLAHHPAIDWDAVRATPKGRPSPLSRLTRHATDSADVDDSASDVTPAGRQGTSVLA